MLAGEGVASSAGPIVIKTALEAPASPSSTIVLPAQLSQPLPKPKGPFALVADTVRSQGIRGLWLGQTGTFLRESGGGAAWFGTYELLARYFVSRHQAKAEPGHKSTKSDLATWQLMVSGAAAGVGYNVSLFPADSVKSTIQTFSELNPGKPVPSFAQTAAMIWRTRGIRGLYAGCALTCLRSGPSSAMIFGLFETFTTHFSWIFAPRKPPTVAVLA